jgi:hypothetical protein
MISGQRNIHFRYKIVVLFTLTTVYFQETENDIPMTTTGTHTTPIQRYVDDLKFDFIPQSDNSCVIEVCNNPTGNN